MKTISKRILCLIVSVCICFTALPIMFSIKADASEPQLSSRCETAINIEVKEASFGEDAADLLSNTAIKLTASMDLSTADVFELDVYIEDINALKAFTTNSQYVQFGFSSRSNRPNANNANINISSQLLQDGWNHIEVKKANFVEANINWSKIYYVYLKFADETQTLPNSLANKTIKYMNICESKANPAMDPDIIPEMIESEGMLVIKEGVKDSGTYGSAPKEWMPNIDFGENKDLSGYDYFQFDYYVENLENLKQLASRLYLNFVSDQSKSQCDIDFLDLLTKDGWNHVKVPKSTASTMSKTRYIRFRITKNDNVTVGSEDQYKTANLVATFRDGSEPYSFNQSVTVGKDQTEIIVTWIDTVDRDGKVVLTKNGDETEFVAVKRFAEEKGLYSYSATITGLTANTSYTYRIVADDLTSEEYTYKTKDFDDTFSFVHIGDVQYNGSSNLLENWKNTLSKINTNFPETSFIVNSGDVSDLSGNNDLYQVVKSPELLKQYAMSVVPGNHDNSKAEDGGGYYTLNFASPNTYEPYEGYALNGYDYWFSYNNILFISLNSLISDVQYHKNFMTKVVEEQGDKFDWIIVNCHYSLFSASYHSTESATINHRDGLAPLFTELGVDLVLSGHDHVYDRSYLMDGARPKADTNDFATSADGVLYISATTASGMKFNTAVDSCKSYSAKIVEEKYGFINYEVSEDEITLTFYNAEDMSVLDAFTLYNDNGDHSVYADSDLLKDKNLQNIKLDSNGNYTVSFDSANITDACTIELDFGLANGNALSDISISLVDANENSATKDFSNLQSGWNHLVANISDFNGVDLTKITAVKLTGIAGTELDIANLYVGHIYTDRGDTTCNGCDHEREKLDDLDPYVIPEMIQSEGMLVIKEGVKDSGTYGSAKNIWEPNIDFGENRNLSGYDYFEFDYYVENLENLKQLASRLYLNFVDRSGGNQTNIDFLDLLTKDGWNHVKVPKSAANNLSTFSGVRFIRFRITKNSDVTVGLEDMFKTANLCATLKGEFTVPNEIVNSIPELPSNIDSILLDDYFAAEYGMGISLQYLLTGSKAVVKRVNPAVDMSKSDFIEFDIYVSDVEKLKAYDEYSLYVSLYTVENGIPEYRADYTFLDQIKGEGWNHIKVDKKSAKSRGAAGSYPYKLDWTNVCAVALMTYSAGVPQVIGTEFAVIANVCGTLKGEFIVPDEIVNSIPELPSNIDSILLDSYFGAEYGEDISLQYLLTGSSAVVKRVNPAVDMSKSDFIEFDIYVSDVEKLKAYDEYSLYVSLYTVENGIPEYRADYTFLDQIKGEGWNHIKVDKKSAKSRGAAGSYPYKLDWTNVCAVALMTYSAGVPEAIGTEFAVIANVCGTLGEESMIPSLPENVITEIKEIDGHLLGDYFGYVSDRIFAEGIGPYDFSKGNTIELDLYVSDYETLKKTLEECPRAEEFMLVFSSVPMNLLSQYSKPRTYYSVQFNLASKITKSGWNHIKIGKNEFVQLLGNMDWSNITSYMLRFSKSKFNEKDEEEKNPAKDVYVKIANIVNTGILSEVPYDEVQSVKPDKEAVYINDAENLVDDNGSWNPADVYLEENYKSENAHSVARVISYETKPEFSKMFYLFDYSADMSDINTLKFDFFIDLPQFIQKQGNVIEVGLSSNRNLEGNYTWKIDTTTLKEGWNSLSFDISSAKKNGEVSLSEIKTFFLRFNEINLSAQDFETVIVAIDNLRYISSNGNTVLKIKEDKEEIFDDTIDAELNTDYLDNEEVVAQTIKLEPKKIHLKETINKVVTNYVAAIIILCVEAVVLAAAVVGFILYKKRKGSK